LTQVGFGPLTHKSIIKILQQKMYRERIKVVLITLVILLQKPFFAQKQKKNNLERKAGRFSI